MRIRFGSRRKTPLTPGQLMVVAPLIGIVMLGIVVLVSQTGSDLERFAERAQLMDAQVIGTHQQRGRPGKRDSVEMMSYLKVRFAPPGFAPMYKDAEVSSDTVEKFKAASEINPMPTRVYYSAIERHRWHDVHELERESSDGTKIAWVFGIIGVGMIGLGGWAFTKWRRGETVMHQPVADEPVSPEVIAAMKRYGIPTMFMPGQEHELAEAEARLHGRPVSSPPPWEGPIADPDAALGGGRPDDHPNTQRKP